MTRVKPFAVLLLVVAIVFTSQVRAAGTRLVVAYIDGDTLYTWRQGDPSPRSIATGNLSQPRLAPDAAHVMYQQDGELGLAAIDGSPHRLVMPASFGTAQDISRLILSAGWLDAHTILLNTYRFSPKMLVKQQFADDLWRIDINTGQLIRLLNDGQGGAFTISPDGKSIAVVRAGNYADQTQGSISVLDADGKNAKALFTFPFVNTAASYQFYAAPKWSADSRSLLVAIPDPNLVYAMTDIPPTVLWQIGLDGTKTRLGEVHADFFSLPEFSPDGKSVLYARRIGKPEDNQIAVFQAASDGTGEKEIVRDAIGKLEPAHWSPDGKLYTFVHGAPGSLWINAPQGLKRFPGEHEPLFDLIWADAATGVYTTSVGGSGELRYVEVNGLDTGQPVIIVKRSTGGDFDAIREL